MALRVSSAGKDLSELALTARFLPRGLGGLVYWYALYPFHHWIFRGMLINMARFLNRPLVGGPERFDAFDEGACRVG